MSTTYLLFTEIKIKDVWTCICPYIRKEDGKEVMFTTYESGSRTFFGSTYDKLRELSIGIDFPNGLSATLKKRFHDDILEDAKKYKNLFEYNPESTLDYYKSVMICVPFSNIKNALPCGADTKYQYHGIFHKDLVYQYESGEVEYIEPVERSEYAKLDEKEKEAYIYYEYDDPMDWPYHFKEIINAVNLDVSRYIDATANWGTKPEIRIIAFAL